ncbi:hypothetical protein LSP03_00210 [Lysinibacillus sphaericus]|nr:hypothetical protein LSP03_00210 [Lysinibacillus sphaericus]
MKLMAIKELYRQLNKELVSYKNKEVFDLVVATLSKTDNEYPFAD